MSNIIYPWHPKCFVLSTNVVDIVTVCVLFYGWRPKEKISTWWTMNFLSYLIFLYTHKQNMLDHESMWTLCCFRICVKLFFIRSKIAHIVLFFALYFLGFFSNSFPDLFLSIPFSSFGFYLYITPAWQRFCNQLAVLYILLNYSLFCLHLDASGISYMHLSLPFLTTLWHKPNIHRYKYVCWDQCRHQRIKGRMRLKLHHLLYIPSSYSACIRVEISFHIIKEWFGL